MPVENRGAMKALMPGWFRAFPGQRFAAYALASCVVTVVSVYGGMRDDSIPQKYDYLPDIFWAPALPAVVAAWFLKDKASKILGLAALLVAPFAGDGSVYLGWAVCALVFLSVVDDPAPRPIVGWLGGVVGSALSLVLWPPGPSVAPFVATAMGVVFALPFGYRTRSLALAADAEALRGHTTWLEQRTLLARELHDVVGHHVTAMVVQAEAGQVGEPTAALQTIARSGRQALQDLDSLVVHLRDPGATLSMAAPPALGDIDEMLAGPLRAQGVVVEVSVDPQPGLDEVQVLATYRIVQEALTNVARHAGARYTWVEVRGTEDGVRVRVSDDGSGPPQHVIRGSGLVGIRERVIALGGTYDFGTRPGGGAMLDVVLPVPE